MASKKLKRKRPKLTALKLSDSDLDKLAEITEQDIISSNTEWREHAKRTGLLESTPELDEGDTNA
jgi:hypothetical protein